LKVRVLGAAAIFLYCLFPSILVAGAASEFQTTASFSLNVQKSNVLGLGKSALATKSAFATYTNEFFGGRTNALKIQFFTQPIGDDARARLLKNDDREISKGGTAVFVLFLDRGNHITQANLTYVIPGTTVVRTVASTRAEVAKYFADYHFESNRLRLKSKGIYNTAPKADEVLALSWDANLNIPVFDQIAK